MKRATDFVLKRFSFLLIKRLTIGICLFAWLTRAFFLTLTPVLSGDETHPIVACRYDCATQFNHADWAERWELVEKYSGADSGAKVLWIVNYLLVGKIFPTQKGDVAYAFNLLMAFLCMLALALAARRLYGVEGFWLCLLIVSISPFHFNYSIRLLGAMPVATWIALALYFLTAPLGSLIAWIAAGFCFGMAFGTHYAAGTAILPIAGGLAISIAARIFQSRMTVLETIRSVLWPLTLGVLFAFLPLALLELWSRSAGKSYFANLVHHPQFSVIPNAGPYGLWLRVLFELDPLLEVFAVLGLLCLFFLANRTWMRMVALFVSFTFFGLLALSIDLEFPRSIISILLFAFVGGLCFRWMRRQDMDAVNPRKVPLPDNIKSAAILDHAALISTLAIALVLLTSWRTISMMPRFVFPIWPVIALFMVGSICAMSRSTRRITTVFIMIMGTFLFSIAAGVTVGAKSVEARAEQYARRREDRKPLYYYEFFPKGAAYKKLQNRSEDKVKVYSAFVELYPSNPYEEELYKIEDIRSLLRQHKLDHLFYAEETVNAQIFYKERVINAEASNVRESHASFKLTAVKIDYPDQWKAGEPSTVHLTVRNDGKLPLNSERVEPLRDFNVEAGQHVQPMLGYHWTRVVGAKEYEVEVWDDGQRVELRAELQPGETQEIEMPVYAPKRPDNYLLTIEPLFHVGQNKQWISGSAFEAHEIRVHGE